jgi:hypothetical protein
MTSPSCTSCRTTRTAPLASGSRPSRPSSRATSSRLFKTARTLPSVFTTRYSIPTFVCPTRPQPNPVRWGLGCALGHARRGPFRRLWPLDRSRGLLHSCPRAHSRLTDPEVPREVLTTSSMVIVDFWAPRTPPRCARGSQSGRSPPNRTEATETPRLRGLLPPDQLRQAQRMHRDLRHHHRGHRGCPRERQRPPGGGL